MALHPCVECPTLIPRGQTRCADHERRYDRRRGTAQERGFTYRWSQFRDAWLGRFPLCGMRADGQLHGEHSRCVQQGLTVAAECVDHIDGHSRPDDRATFYDPTRLQSLCLNCNRIKAIEHEGGFGR